MTEIDKRIKVIGRIQNLYGELDAIYNELSEFDDNESYNFLLARYDITSVSFNLLMKNKSDMNIM